MHSSLDRPARELASGCILRMQMQREAGRPCSSCIALHGQSVLQAGMPPALGKC